MKTKYGILKGIEDAEYYSNGNIKLCRLKELNVLKTKLGTFVPQFETKDERRKITGTLEFYENGDILSICLDEQIIIETKAGNIPAEKIIFYKGERIKRIFPLNGKLSGYWDEDKEYSLTTKLELEINEEKFISKYISIAFYESEKIKSLTLWPRERMEINISGALVSVRKGISFYENGVIKSFEPAKEIDLHTPIGILSAFHNEIVGLNGDINSVEYKENGQIKTLYTCSNEFKISNGIEKHTVKPQLKAGWCNELIKIPNPIKVEFKEDKIIFDSEKIFSLIESNISIIKLQYKAISENLTC